MFLSLTRSKKFGLFRFLSLTILFSFLVTTLTPVPLVQAQGVSLLNLPVPGTMVNPSEAFVPVLLKGLTIDPEDPFRFDFIVDSGSSVNARVLNILSEDLFANGFLNSHLAGK